MMRALLKSESHERRSSIGLALLALAALGASSPEVVKVRVPSDQVARWFPPGSDLRVLPYDRFEALVKSLRDRPPPHRPPRLLKATHSARWEAGRLLGRSELAVESSTGDGPGLLVLEPWSPALLDRGAGAKRLRATSDGQLALKLDPTGLQSIEFEWTLGARPGSEGRAFALELPGVDVSSLSLDLPPGFVPEATAGDRVGPAPGRSAWRFEEATGRVDLRLLDPADDAKRGNSPSLWLEGPTRVDLGASPTNWRADWTLDGSPGAPRSLTIGLNPGLDLVDVVGPRVASFRVEPDGLGSKVSITLGGEGAGPSPLTLRAICQAPAEGTWTVPSARPLDAHWTGGRTVVLLGSGRIFQSCEERSGRRVPPRPGELTGSSALIFEPKWGQGPVADLTFHPPTADSTFDVRGLLKLGDDIPRFEAALTWRVEKGRLLAFAVDLPPGWTPDGVVTPAGLPVPWHADKHGNGGLRVHIDPPPTEDDSKAITLTLTGSARDAGVSGSLDLPRVRPAPGVRIVDEIWVATPEPGLAIRPILGHGLAWLDPPDQPADDTPAPWDAGDHEGALAWRWLSEDAEGAIDREPPRADRRGDARLEAMIGEGRLALEWSIDVESPRGDLEPIPIHLDEPVAGPILWKMRGAGSPILEARPLEAARRASLGFPATGAAWDLILPGPTRGKIELTGHAEVPWSGRGQIPLLTLPARYRTRGTVAILVEKPTQVKFESTGLAKLEPSALGGNATAVDPAPSTDPRWRRAAVFGHGPSGGRLIVETSSSRFEPSGGLVREAALISQVSAGAGLRHRLNLGIAADQARSIALTMPRGTAIDRLRRDGQAIAPTPSGDQFLVEIPAPGPGRPLCSLTIEYQTEDDPRSGPIEPSRLLPRLSLPCLGFSWEIVAPEPWVLSDVGQGLAMTDPRPSPSLASRLLGFEGSPWGYRDEARWAKSDAAMLGDLDQSAREIADGETNLGDWILKLDAGRWPMVVDRLSIRASGWGPGSRIEPGSAAMKSLGPVRSVLEPMGLAAIPLDGVILIAAKGEIPGRPSDREAWSTALRRVPSEDDDVTDRFQSATRWRGEVTPRAQASGESNGRPDLGEKWHTWRVVSAGWPAEGASVSLVDGRAEQGWGWFLASVVLVAGVLSRGRSPRARAWGLVAVGVVASVGLAWDWPGPSSTFSGLFRGGLGVLAFWVGRSFRPASSSPSNTPVEGSTTSRRIGLLTGPLQTLFLVVAAWVGIASAGSETDLPILALLPFEGPADPASKPDRAVLLVKDHERLERLARGDGRASTASVSLVTARHKVGRDEPGLAMVESLYEVEVGGEGPAFWTFPVGSAIELSAEVDSLASPLAIAPDGLSANVGLNGTGRHLVRFRRLVPLSVLGQGGVRARVPINRAAFARVLVIKGGSPSWVEVVGASGELVAGAEGIQGDLGPLDALEVHWFPEKGPTTPGLRGPVEATFLWDARPVGDLIRMRLVHSDPEGASALRIAMEPGLMVRRHLIPNVVSTRLEGTPARPVWVVHLDPPLPKDVPIEVEFWRPASSESARRTWPEIDLPTAEKLSGLIGLRRPSDWSGRLSLRAGIEPASEAAFARAWGVLPDDGMTLAGAARFGRSVALEVETRPVPVRRSIETRLVLGLAPGRLDASIEGTLTEHQGRSFGLDVTIPSDLRVIKVEADGLSGWRRISRERLSLQFDGSEFPQRRIRVVAYLPAPADKVMSESRTYEAKAPWPLWVDAESTSGTVEISSPTRIQFEPPEGFTLVPVEGPGSPYRLAYRVDQPSNQATIRWSAPSARVNVEVESELEIDPARLTWTAGLTCEVSGGPAESLNLNLPTEWANSTTLEIEGITHRLVAQASGPNGESTQWKILLDKPIWGRGRLILRSQRPWRPGLEIAYPQVAPLAATGRGSVKRYDVAILNSSGRPMEVAGSSGLQPIDASRFHPLDSPTPSARPIDHAYHVTGGRWSLRLKIGRPGDESTPGPDAREARVAFARLACVLASDGSTSGRAFYELQAQPGPFLAIQLPPGADIPWTSVEGAIGPALHESPGRWLIPLGDGQPRWVNFAWHLPATNPTSGSIPWPSPEGSAPPCLISVDAPSHHDVQLPEAGMERIGTLAWEVENIEHLSRKLVESFGNLDRSSSRDREEIVEELSEIEWRVRHCSRVPVAKDATADPAAGRLQGALEAIADASELAGLDDLTREARARVGVAPPVEGLVGGATAPSPEILRLRRSGVTHRFRSAGGDLKRPPAISWVEKTPVRRSERAVSWAIAGLGILAWLAVGVFLARGFRPNGRLSTSLVAVTLLALLAWEPVGILTTLGLVAWGRVSG